MSSFLIVHTCGTAKAFTAHQFTVNNGLRIFALGLACVPIPDMHDSIKGQGLLKIS